jgi:hypothetical protein
MVMQRRQPSFRDIVAAVKATPQAWPANAVEPGTVLAPGGRTHRETVDELSAAAAFDAAAAGALVAWDPCGCNGYCGLIWFDRADVARMVAAGRPHIRRTKKAFGSIAEYRSDDGHVLLLVEQRVRWGGFLS